LIVTRNPHPPRKHALLLNVGIRHATKKYILQIGSEVEFYTDSILQMREALENYPSHYALASMAYLPFDFQVTEENIGSLHFMFYGNMMVERKFLEQINGYDETFINRGGEDDNIRRRLELAGIRKLALPEAKTLHREKEYMPGTRFKKASSHPVTELRRMLYPDETVANREGWGNEFGGLVYDWQDNQYAEELCRNYFDSFLQYEISDSTIFRKNYKKVILCQAYNEEEFMPGFLEDMAKYFDGIILLDDESADSTWELARHGKLLLKVKKKRECFNDLENRNILLNIASFIKSEWFCFMDIDERFDERFVDFKTFENDQEVDVSVFRYIDLWDSEEYYYVSSPYSRNGINRRMRMFRNKGRMQINTKQKKLHFAATPLIGNKFESAVLFKHYGKLTSEMRQNKYQFYRKEDTYMDQKDYSYLLENGLSRDIRNIEGNDLIFFRRIILKVNNLSE